MKRLGNKVVVITGGGKGIGEAIARRFLHEGASVVLADFDGALAQATAERLDPAGERVLGLRCDVAEKADVVATVAEVVARFGRIDILVNNAGITKTIPSDLMEKFTQKIPMKRLGAPDEVAAVAAFLASDDSSFMTGQVLTLCGGPRH